MAAPVASYITLADDTAAVGPKARSQSRVVSSNTVHEHFTDDADETSGRLDSRIYTVSPGVLTAVATGHTALQGHLWFINPTSSDVMVAPKRCVVSTMVVAAAAVFARLQMELVTFVGACTGAQIIPVQVDTSERAAVAEMRTASTGLTLSSVNNNAAMFTFWLMPALTITIAGCAPPPVQSGWYPPTSRRDRGQRVYLKPGEGIVFRQPDNGDTDQRFVINMEWEEYSLLI